MVIATGGIKEVRHVDKYQNFWFTVFLPVPQAGQKMLKLRCIGCRELIKLDYKKPTHISGIIEYNGVYIPVIDPSILLLGKPTTFTNLSCILIIPHKWNYEQLHTGVLVENIDEIMEYASIKPDTSPLKDISTNIRLIMDMHKNPGAELWLYENHRMLDACRRESQQEEDYITFKRICSEKTLSV